MTREGQVLALLANDVRYWLSLPVFGACLLLAVGIVGLTLTGVGGGGVSLFRAVLGGPQVQILGGRLIEGPDWTWLLTGVLFVVASLGLVDTGPAWVGLTLARGVSRSRWAVARLVALALGALVFLAVLVGVIALAVVTGWRPGPLITSGTAWDLGLWGVGLVSLGWFATALDLVTGTVWPSLAVTLLLLGVARFGGAVSPYIPFAQWMISLHYLRGTLSVEGGVFYVLLWTALSGAAVLWAAHTRLMSHES
ncbi:MAG: hypothetical protein ACYCOS_03875 [Sulfobacillus sp.]